MPPLANNDLEGVPSIIDVIKKKDVACFYPFQKFDYVIDFNTYKFKKRSKGK